MTSSANITAGHQELLDEEDFHSLFDDLDALEPFDVKKEEIAAQLAALLSHKKTTRSSFSRLSGWKRSRVTNVLNGNGNPTFKTLWEFAKHLGYEADLNFRLPTERHASQPWQVRASSSFQSMINWRPLDELQNIPNILLNLQAAHEVANDLLNGNNQSHYISIAKTQNYLLNAEQKTLTQAVNKVPMSIPSTTAFLRNI